MRRVCDSAEFLAGLWNFGSLNLKGMARFFFNIFDIDREGYISGVRAACVLPVCPPCESVRDIVCVRVLF